MTGTTQHPPRPRKARRTRNSGIESAALAFWVAAPWAIGLLILGMEVTG